jgi:hypothetical protein
MPRVAKTKEFAARNTVTLNYDQILQAISSQGLWVPFRNDGLLQGLATFGPRTSCGNLASFSQQQDMLL